MSRLPTRPPTPVSKGKTVAMGRKKFLFLGVFLGLTGCQLTPPEEIVIESYYFDFRDDLFGWKGDFSDYPVGDSTLLGLTFSYEGLPGSSEKALRLSGNCKGESLFMFVKRRISGLKPSTPYGIGFDVSFATNAPVGYDHEGNIPGDKVYMKAGATPFEPTKAVHEGQYQMNIDKGSAFTAGDDMVIIGNIASSGDYPSYSFENRSNANSFTAMSNADGEIWLIIGTDTGHQGLTTLYYRRIAVVLSVAP